MTVVTIARISAGGDGVARLPDGLVVFVPRTAPDDEALVQVEERRKRYARGRVVELIRPGAARREPRCPHYTTDRCGGCQLQHLTPAAQLDVKRAIVGDALRRISHRDVPDPEIIPAPAEWGYRTKITLAVSGQRIGLHQLEAPTEVFALRDCLITREPLMGLWSQVSRQRALLPPNTEEVVLREDRAGGLHVVVGGGAEPWDAPALAAAVGVAGVSYWWRPKGGGARVVAGPQTGFPALAFEQVNPVLGSRIRDDAVLALGEVSGKLAWDLYGGVGDTARLLAARGATVWSVDRDRGAVEWARRQEGGPRVRWVTGMVEESLHRLPVPDVVVVNPPRTGLAARVCTALEDWATRRAGARLAYVSCDPATLARDLTRLPSLSLVRVQAYDLFPQTSHVETLAVLEPR